MRFVPRMSICSILQLESTMASVVDTDRIGADAIGRRIDGADEKTLITHSEEYGEQQKSSGLEVL